MLSSVVRYMIALHANSSQFELQKQERENQNCKRHSDWLSEELNRKSNETVELKREKAKESLAWKAEFTQMQEELQHKSDELEQLRKDKVAVDLLLSQQMEQIRQLKDAGADSESRFQQQISTQT